MLLQPAFARMPLSGWLPGQRVVQSETNDNTSFVAFDGSDEFRYIVWWVYDVVIACQQIAIIIVATPEEFT